MKTIAVLGGGIGGLAASHYLCKSSQVTKVILLESSSRFGGWLSSTRRSDGAVFEHGPRGIRPAGAVGHNTLNMVDDLSLGGEVLPVTSDHVASKNRYLYVNKRLHRMPSGFRSVVVKKELSRKAQLTIYRSIYVPTLTCGQELWVVTERMRSRLKGASFLGGLFHTVPPFSRPLLWSVASEILVKKSKSDDESIHSFVSRRLGKELADIAVDSLCRGVFAGDCRKLSVRSCFPPLFNAEQRRGSLTLGMLLGSGSTAVVPPGPLVQRSIKESWTQWSLRRGLESLPESITDFLQQSGRVELHRGAAIKHLIPSASGWEIHLEDGVLSVDHIISALPAKALSSALPSSCQPLIQQLQDICNVTVAVVNLEYEGSILPVTGFGHLLPSSEDRGVLGVVYDSVPFPQHNRPNGETTRLTVMMGGAWFQEVFGAPDAVTEECLLAKASEAVSQHLGVTTEPSWSRVSLQKDCIPQYYQGHYKSVEIMRRFIKEKNLSLSLIGSSYDGVSVNDVIFGGRTAVQELLGSEV